HRAAPSLPRKHGPQSWPDERALPQPIDSPCLDPRRCKSSGSLRSGAARRHAHLARSKILCRKRKGGAGNHRATISQGDRRFVLARHPLSPCGRDFPRSGTRIVWSLLSGLASYSGPKTTAAISLAIAPEIPSVASGNTRPQYLRARMPKTFYLTTAI